MGSPPVAMVYAGLLASQQTWMLPGGAEVEGVAWGFHAISIVGDPGGGEYSSRNKFTPSDEPNLTRLTS